MKRADIIPLIAEILVNYKIPLGYKEHCRFRTIFVSDDALILSKIEPIQAICWSGISPNLHGLARLPF